jgi:hypothetical protein
MDRSACHIRFAQAGNCMTAVFTIWAAEFFLESAGAILNFKRSRLLSFILALIALMDVATFFVFRFWPEHYWQATWIRHAIRNMLFIWLGCSICGMFSEKRIQSAITAAFLSLSAAVLVFSVGFAGETIKDKLLDAEIVACLTLLAYIAVVWISGNALESDNKWKTAGFLVMVGSDLIFTMLWDGMPTLKLGHFTIPAWHWDGARHWYWTGATLAYGVWVAGPLRRVRLGEFRVSLEKKFPAVEEMRVM